MSDAVEDGAEEEFTLPTPPETTTYRPMKLGMSVDEETGAVTLLFIVSPIKYVEVIISAGAAASIKASIPDVNVSGIVTPPKPQIVRV
jgi:hypothetical protein